MNPTVKFAFAACAIVLVLGLPFWANPGLVFLAGVTIIGATFSLSWNLLFGFTGLASFGNAGFFAIGAYIAAVPLRDGYGALFLPLLLAAALAGALVALVIGLAALRRSSGIHLAILTLALSEVLRVAISHTAMLGYNDGLPNIPRPRLFGINLAAGENYYWFLCIACGLLTAILWWIVHSRFGRTLRAIRMDPDRTQFIGVNVAGYRLFAFVISGAVGSLTGALYAPWSQIVTPDLAHWIKSTQPILYTLLGGASSFWGPVVGALAFSVLEYSTRTLVGVSEIVTGVILLVVLLAAPDGLIGVWRRVVARIVAKKPRAVEASGGALPELKEKLS